MTELELLEMLSCVQSSYIQQADAFREGRLRIVRKKRPVVTALKILSVAAMFVLILGAGYFGLQNLAAKQASEKASETMAAQSGAMADAEDWQRMVLRDGIRFYNGDFANSYNSYTVSEFCGVLAKWMRRSLPGMQSWIWTAMGLRSWWWNWKAPAICQGWYWAALTGRSWEKSTMNAR